MGNRLANATSPYLLQHAENPVDWYEWGDEAFAAATLTDRPVLLSVGYSACHWCHVMAHESFEDPATASYMNDHFVNVKVDREERPDVDRIYMDAVTAMSGHGGWPMTVFMTPDGRPFFAGTYFPKERLHGRSSFRDVMSAVTDAWQNNRDELVAQADKVTAAIRRSLPASSDLPDEADVGRAVAHLHAQFDAQHGGFGGAPKFPQAPTLELLMRVAALGPDGDAGKAALAMLTKTLDEMRRGGIYDHLGGGFARYSVDRLWLVPHFEKMLYDNALLARVYLRAGQLTGVDDFVATARETLDYLIRDMTDPEGGIHSAEDADSEGVEGRFYVWTWQELGDVLGRDRHLATSIYGASEDGNFEGSNILFLPEPLPALAAKIGVGVQELSIEKRSIDDRLGAARSQRIRPGLDDKVVTAWNGLALRAFAEAGAVLGEPRYLEAAIGVADFLTRPAWQDGGPVRSWRRGVPGVPGFSDDFAAAAIGLYSLYQTTGDERWFARAEELTAALVTRFADPKGGFFATAEGGDRLITRPKNLQDNPTPSDNSLAAEALAIHAAYTGDGEALALIEGIVRAAGVIIEQSPSFAGHLLAVWATVLNGIEEVAVVAPQETRSRFTDVIWEQFRPEVVLAFSDEATSSVPLLAERTPGSSGRGFVCRGFVCELPAETPEQLRDQLSGATAG
jgi:uncharacterized protein YyaL (SSP411 family)